MILHILAACLILAFFAAPATADMIVYGWRSPEGAYEFTDDINRVPDANLEFVQRIDVDGLETYERFTKIESDEE
jgi:hypothetical protein